MQMPVPEWLTTAEVAAYLRISQRTVLRYVRAGMYDRVQRLGPDGRTIRIHRSELDETEQDGRMVA